MTSSQHSNLQVTITVTCLNFTGTGSRILLHPLSSSRRVILSRKIALNSNWEVNYRELARRPWYITINCELLSTIDICKMLIIFCIVTGLEVLWREDSENVSTMYHSWTETLETGKYIPTLQNKKAVSRHAHLDSYDQLRRSHITQYRCGYCKLSDYL